MADVTIPVNPPSQVVDQGDNVTASSGHYVTVHDMNNNAQAGPTFNFELKRIQIPPGLAHHRIVIQYHGNNIRHVCKKLDTLSTNDIDEFTSRPLYLPENSYFYFMPSFSYTTNLGVSSTNKCLYYDRIYVTHEDNEYTYASELSNIPSDYEELYRKTIKPYNEEFDISNDTYVYYNGETTGNCIDEIIRGELSRGGTDNLTFRAFTFSDGTFKKVRAWTDKSYIPEEYIN